jgi:hypothetical protein
MKNHISLPQFGHMILKELLLFFTSNISLRYLYAQLLVHFKREFLKTLYAFLLPYEESNIITTVWDVHQSIISLIGSFLKELMPLFTQNIWSKCFCVHLLLQLYILNEISQNFVCLFIILWRIAYIATSVCSGIFEWVIALFQLEHVQQLHFKWEFLIFFCTCLFPLEDSHIAILLYIQIIMPLFIYVSEITTRRSPRSANRTTITWRAGCYCTNTDWLYVPVRGWK